jgi:hypothetical protein
MPDPSLYSLFSEEGRAAYSKLLDRDENNPGGGDVAASIVWPSPLYGTPDHRTFASEMAKVLAGDAYNYAYIAKQGGDPVWNDTKRDHLRAFRSWIEDYDRRADRLAGLPPGSNPADPLVRQRIQDVYKGVWPGIGFPVPGGNQEPGFESEMPNRLFSLNGRSGWSSLPSLGQNYANVWRE